MKKNNNYNIIKIILIIFIIFLIYYFSKNNFFINVKESIDNSLNVVPSVDNSLNLVQSVDNNLPPATMQPASLPPATLPPATMQPDSLPPATLPPPTMQPDSLPAPTMQPSSLLFTSLPPSTLPLSTLPAPTLPAPSLPAPSLPPASLPAPTLPAPITIIKTNPNYIITQDYIMNDEGYLNINDGNYNIIWDTYLLVDNTTNNPINNPITLIPESKTNLNNSNCIWEIKKISAIINNMNTECITIVNKSTKRYLGIGYSDRDIPKISTSDASTKDLNYFSTTDKITTNNYWKLKIKTGLILANNINKEIYVSENKYYLFNNLYYMTYVFNSNIPIKTYTFKLNNTN